MSHYENLGVSKDATPEEIKQAYRARGREKHPDKGGDAAEFAEISNAYEVLSDPSRKLLYDATGQDRQRPPIEDEVRNILLDMFSRVLSDELVVESTVETIRTQIKNVAANMRTEIQKLKDRRAKLKNRRGKIKAKGAVNLAHMVIDREIENIDKAVTGADHQLSLEKALLKELKKYTEEREKPIYRPVRFESVSMWH